MSDRIYRRPGLHATHLRLRRVSFFLFALALLVGAAAAFVQGAAAQQQTTSVTVTGTVVDATGSPIAEAQILSGSCDLLASTGADGKFTVPADAGTVSIEAAHFAPATMTVGRQAPLRIELVHPFENITVTAYRSPLSSLDSPASCLTHCARLLPHGCRRIGTPQGALAVPPIDSDVGPGDPGQGRHHLLAARVTVHG